jgi:hypothetical protein
MATRTEKPSFFWMYLSPPLFGVAQAAVGTPLDVIATREILDRKKTLQILKETAVKDYGKGFQPNTLKSITRTPVQFFAANFFSSIIPTDDHPAMRGFTLGLLTSVSETFLFNVFNATRTRFIQGQKWKDISSSVLLKGLSATLSYRILSSAIFFSLYEPFKIKYPSQGMIVSTCAGIVQAILSAPFYIAAIEQQRKNAVLESLWHTLVRLKKRDGFIQGLVFPALTPRLVHTIAITGLFMKLIDDKLGLIHRKS